MSINLLSRKVCGCFALAALLLVGACTHTPPTAARPFTVVMLPDTQFYSKSHPDLFHAQTDWIKQNRKWENIVFVTHMGDIVDGRSRVMAQWTVASNAMAHLNRVVPWGVAIGNHDYDTDKIKEGVATTWLKHFGPTRFKGRKWYGGASPNGLNSYQLFSASGIDFLILHLEVNAPDEAIAWAEQVLRKHPKRAAIVSTHIYLKGRDGFTRNQQHEYRPNGNSGDGIWEKLVRRHPQIFMVLCGHEGRAFEYHQVSTNDAGHRVVEMLADYQRRANGGDAWLRLIRFVPATRQIEIRTYSPALNQFETDENSNFVVPWEMPAVCWGK